MVKVNADTIVIDRQGSKDVTGIIDQAINGSNGKAGDIEVTATGTIWVQNGGIISSSTFSSGDAGSVKVNAGTIVIDGQGQRSNDVTGITDQANAGTGKAGNIEVTATGTLSVQNGGVISSSTFSSGDAGTVNVSAATLLVDGDSTSIKAKASSGSFGQTGNVIVLATDQMMISNGGSVSIQNDATATNAANLTPTLLTVTAPTITLKDATITSASTGNVSASNIQVIATERLSIDPSSITTSANLGNGGAITIQGGKVMTLDNSQITTSVKGLAGDGGDITISANTLFMNTGFIQANTAATNAAGGRVGMDVQMLVPSGSSLFVGGQTPYTFQPGVFGFNVIQAAAPTGISGTIQMTSPALNISGSLNGLNTQVMDTGGLGRSPCQITGGSSLAQSGRGGLAPSALGLLRTEPGFVPVKSGASSTGMVDQPLALNLWSCN